MLNEQHCGDFSKKPYNHCEKQSRIMVFVKSLVQQYGELLRESDFPWEQSLIPLKVFIFNCCFRGKCCPEADLNRNFKHQRIFFL